MGYSHGERCPGDMSDFQGLPPPVWQVVYPDKQEIK